MPTDAITDDESRWAAVLGRDGTADGGFVYAVASTGIYCRPSCPSRRPRRNPVSAPECTRPAARRRRVADISQRSPRVAGPGGRDGARRSYARAGDVARLLRRVAASVVELVPLGT